MQQNSTTVVTNKTSWKKDANQTLNKIKPFVTRKKENKAGFCWLTPL